MDTDAMQPNDISMPTPSPLVGSEGTSPLGSIPPSRKLRLPLWLMTVGAGLVAGLVSWAGGEAMFDRFRIEDEIIYPENYKKISGYEKQNVSARIHGDAAHVVERKKAAASFGLLGLALGVCLGLAGGLTAGSGKAAIVGAVGGGIAGSVVGGGLSYSVVPLFYQYFDPEQGLMILFFTHAAIFAGLGAAAGVGLGLGLVDRSALGGSLFGGMFGALVGTVAFETANSLAFPLMRTYDPISTEWLPRMLIYLCVAVGTALVAGLAAGGGTRKPAPVPAG